MSHDGRSAARPPLITAVAPDPRRPGSVRIEVDRVPFASVSEEVAAAEGLTVGRAVDGPLRERLGAQADVEAAFRTAVRALERRSFARADLARRLRRKGHAGAAVEAALERAASLRLLDDADYALHYVATRAARGRGPLRLTRDLLAMGVERRLIDQALAAHFDEAADRSAMPLQLATKRAAQLGALPREVKRRRVLAYLARRGFTGHDVGELVRKVVG